MTVTGSTSRLVPLLGGPQRRTHYGGYRRHATTRAQPQAFRVRRHASRAPAPPTAATAHTNSARFGKELFGHGDWAPRTAAAPLRTPRGCRRPPPLAFTAEARVELALCGAATMPSVVIVNTRNGPEPVIRDRSWPLVGGDDRLPDERITLVHLLDVEHEPLRISRREVLAVSRRGHDVDQASGEDALRGVERFLIRERDAATPRRRPSVPEPTTKKTARLPPSPSTPHAS